MVRITFSPKWEGWWDSTNSETFHEWPEPMKVCGERLLMAVCSKVNFSLKPGAQLVFLCSEKSGMECFGSFSCFDSFLLLFRNNGVSLFLWHRHLVGVSCAWVANAFSMADTTLWVWQIEAFFCGQAKVPPSVPNWCKNIACFFEFEEKCESHQKSKKKKQKLWIC